MRIAYYAPLNAPVPGTPSGDRYVAGALMQALERAGHRVELASTFRSFDGGGDGHRQAALQREGHAIAEQLSARWVDAAAGARPQLWFTYHLYYKAPDWLGPSVARRLGIPYVIAEASHAAKRAAGPWSLGHDACVDAIGHAALLICPSRDDIDALAVLTGAPQKVAYLPPFLDVAPLRAAAAERDLHRARIAARHGLDPSTPWILAVAMMRPGDKLASYRALGAALARLLDLPWSLLVAGDGAARAEVESTLAAAIPERATFLGQLDRAALAGVYAGSDVLAWPAVNEAYGMALLEAQCAGVPVVAAKLRGVPDVVQDGLTGLLAPPADDAGLAACVRELLVDPERRRALGQAAGEFVSAERSIEVAARRLAGLLARFDRGQVLPFASAKQKARPDPPRVLLYVQHLLGIGHLKRAMTLAQAFDGAGFDVTVVSGGCEVPAIVPAGARIVQLPAASAADLSFKQLVDAAGQPVDEQWKDARREALLAAYRQIDPDILLVELFPFGRRQMRFELLPLLDAATQAAHRPLIVSSVREIGGGGQRDEARQLETIALVQRYFDCVLVHGDPAVLAFEDNFPLAARIAPLIRHTGYVVAPIERANGLAGAGEVLVSAGGGAVGRPLLEAALRARPLSEVAHLPWRLITGINASSADTAMIEALAQRTGEGRTTVERMRADFTTLLANCAVSVSQAGYNTIMEILATRARAVVVPFAAGAETEQWLRAKALAQRGHVQLVAEADLGPATLAAAIDRAALGAPPPAAAIDLDGAGASARVLRSLLAERSH